MGDDDFLMVYRVMGMLQNVAIEIDRRPIRSLIDMLLRRKPRQPDQKRRSFKVMLCDSPFSALRADNVPKLGDKHPENPALAVSKKSACIESVSFKEARVDVEYADEPYVWARLCHDVLIGRCE